MPGCSIEKKSFLNVISELAKENKKIFVLDKRGEDIRKAKIPEKSVFILGDHNGLPRKELKRLKKIAESISVGPRIYFASQIITILNNTLDLRGL